jgi:hypothetical protein
VQQLLKASAPTARRSIGVLGKAGVLVETTGKLRDRAFIYRRYVKALTAWGGDSAGGPVASSLERKRAGLSQTLKRLSE